MDHRSTDGVSDAQVVEAGLPVGAGRGLFEAPSITCSHCQRVVILNPLRNRERPYCRKCDHYICDSCGPALAATGICKPFRQVLDELQEEAERTTSTEIIIARS